MADVELVEWRAASGEGDRAGARGAVQHRSSIGGSRNATYIKPGRNSELGGALTGRRGADLRPRGLARAAAPPASSGQPRGKQPDSPDVLVQGGLDEDDSMLECTVASNSWLDERERSPLSASFRSQTYFEPSCPPFNCSPALSLSSTSHPRLPGPRSTM